MDLIFLSRVLIKNLSELQHLQHYNRYYIGITIFNVIRSCGLKLVRPCLILN